MGLIVRLQSDPSQSGFITITVNISVCAHWGKKKKKKKKAAADLTAVQNPQSYLIKWDYGTT